MHESVMQWVGSKIREYNLSGRKTLEVGSLDVNGSVRPLFESADYVAVDMVDGPGVDIVMNAHNLRFPSETFDVVICSEMLEHDDAFWVSMGEMGRVLRVGGILVLTARGNGFPEHAYPEDYWRFMPVSFGLLFDLAGCAPLEVCLDPQVPGVFGIGHKT